MILLQRALFSVAAGFWLVIGALAIFGIVDLRFGSANAARVLGILMLGRRDYHPTNVLWRGAR